MNITVGKVAQYNDTDTDTPLLAVPYNIMDADGALLSERVQSFPLDTSVEEIEAFMRMALQVYKDNVARYEASKGMQEKADKAAEVANSITGLKIN